MKRIILFLLVTSISLFSIDTETLEKIVAKLLSNHDNLMKTYDTNKPHLSRRFFMDGGDGEEGCTALESEINTKTNLLAQLLRVSIEKQSNREFTSLNCISLAELPTRLEHLFEKNCYEYSDRLPYENFKFHSKGDSPFFNRTCTNIGEALKKWKEMQPSSPQNPS